ncbi:MAG: hypothetical protein HY343_08325 [Lentisphaerae bacterium]|nr:hypothetical protein [Lentisphaerota bacterium]
MSHLLMPYIPLAGSLVFQHEPEGQVPPCRLFPGFTPKWFRQHAEIDFGKRWHTDPHYRQATTVEMAKCLNRVFPELRLGGDPARMQGSISQIRTASFMAALFGLDILFFPDNWPANHGATLTDGQVDRLEVPDFRASAVFQDLERQCELIRKEWGRIPGELNYQGVLNTAFRLRGEELFVDMLTAPERAHRLLNVVGETMLRVIDAVYAIQAASGVTHDFFVTANCVVNMISEKQYREFVMPQDRKLSAHFPHFGIHNCAWRVDDYARAYSEIRTHGKDGHDGAWPSNNQEKRLSSTLEGRASSRPSGVLHEALGYLDFGLESDLKRLRSLFPNTTLSVMVTPFELAGKPLETLRRDLVRVREELGACRIVLADIEAGTPPERLVAFFRLASEVWQTPVEALLPVVS